MLQKKKFAQSISKYILQTNKQTNKLSKCCNNKKRRRWKVNVQQTPTYFQYRFSEERSKIFILALASCFITHDLRWTVCCRLNVFRQNCFYAYFTSDHQTLVQFLKDQTCHECINHDSSSKPLLRVAYEVILLYPSRIL